ncbi:MAG: DUF881 domain-containing protein [Bacillota bacterium]|nr:DUF881 domain-containing protein [Bacillota bacterium]
MRNLKEIKSFTEKIRSHIFPAQKVSEKKRRTIGFIFLFTVFFVIGIRIINQDLFYATVDEIYEYKSKISEEEVYIGNLKKELAALKDQISEHSDISINDEELKLKIKEEIERYKSYGGFYPMQGEGVIILVDDGVRDLVDEEEPLSLIVHDVDVRNLVNELNNAGAEAISINENRIVMGLSEVFCNGPTIRINGIQQSRPYVIKAIGDKYKLSKALLDPESYGVDLMKYGIQYELITGSNIEVRGYRGNGTFKYGKALVE